MIGSEEICQDKVQSHAGENRPWHGQEKGDLDDHRFLRGLIHGMRCGIVAVDREGRLAMINDLGGQILGLESRPPVGTPISVALSAHPQIERVLTESFSMTSLPNRAELDLNPGAVNGKTIGFTLSMIPGENEEPTGAAMFFRDLSKIEHREEQERLRDRLAALGQMAATLAHEIRNPLAAIDVTCSLVKRRLGPDPECREMLEKISREVGRLNQTITASLEFVRPVASNLVAGDLPRILEEAIEVAQGRCKKPGIEVIRRFNDRIPPFQMDPLQLRQVFENLILNAMEAIPGEGRVTIEAEVVPTSGASLVPYLPEGAGADDPWSDFEQIAVVRVVDTGPGIETEKAERIFFPFFTTKEQGSGVGLSMAKKIVDSHQGVIDVGEAPNGGALLTVRLPMITRHSED